jgi:hypothetical protein
VARSDLEGGGVRVEPGLVEGRGRAGRKRLRHSFANERESGDQHRAGRAEPREAAAPLSLGRGDVVSHDEGHRRSCG